MLIESGMSIGEACVSLFHQRTGLAMPTARASSRFLSDLISETAVVLAKYMAHLGGQGV
jgi:hypothetical protein